MRSYLETARKHGLQGLDVLVRLFKGNPWMFPTRLRRKWFGRQGVDVVVEHVGLRFAAGFDYSPAGFDLDLAETARLLGLSDRADRGSPFLRALNRTVGFGMAKLTGPEELSVRRRLPPLSHRQVGHLSPALQERHAAWQASQPVAELAESAPAVQRGPARPAGQALGRLGSSPSLDAQLSRHVRPGAGRAQGFER